MRMAANIGTRHAAVSDRKRRTERLGYRRAVRPGGLRDLHVTMDSDAQLAAQDIDVVRGQRSEMSSTIRRGTWRKLWQ